MPLPDDLFTSVEGFISLPEAELLHSLACGVPAGANIVEIGAYKARSTCALALGAKEAGAIVYSVDNHPDYEAGGTKFGMSDNQAYYANISKYGVGDVVRTINLPAALVWQGWQERVAFVFIDGNHEYIEVHRDFVMWSYLTDTILLHDTAGYHPGVSQLLGEILASDEWILAQFVDSITVLKRVVK